jgi:hypothetical protein
MAKYQTLSPPTNWEIVDGEWGTSVELHPATYSAFNGSKFMRLTGSGAVTVRTGKISYQDFRAGLGYYDWSICYQASSIAAGNNITIKMEFYDNTNTLQLTAYLSDTHDKAMNGVTATDTDYEYAGKALTSLSGAFSYAVISITKAAQDFDLDIYGVVARSINPLGEHEDDGTVAVGDAATWTTVPMAQDDSESAKVLPWSAVSDCSYTAAAAGTFLCTGYIKCASVPDGSEFAVSILKTWKNGSTTLRFTGDRICSSAASKDWQIGVTAIIKMEPGDYLLVQAQHYSGGAAGNITVELERFTMVDLAGWQ